PGSTRLRAGNPERLPDELWSGAARRRGLGVVAGFFGGRRAARRRQQLARGRRSSRQPDQLLLRWRGRRRKETETAGLRPLSTGRQALGPTAGEMAESILLGNLCVGRPGLKPRKKARSSMFGHLPPRGRGGRCAFLSASVLLTAAAAVGADSPA